VEVLARAALMLLYCGGNPSFVFFFFGAGSLGGSKLVADVLAPFPFVWPIFVPLSAQDPDPDPRADPEPGPSPDRYKNAEIGNEDSQFHFW
jgi:hypothetical protein